MAGSSGSTPDLPPLEWLRVFEAAGRHGSFTAAARELGLTQAAISQRIRLLEAHLGRALFVRRPRGVELTADGEAYMPQVAGALGSLRRSTADLFGRARRRVQIAAPLSVATLWIAPRLARIAAELPQLEVSVSTIHRSLDFKALGADLEVRFGDGTWPDARCWELFREELVPASARAVWTEGMDWRRLPGIAVAGPRAGWRDWGARFGVEIPSRTALRVDSFAIGLGACLAGAGTVLASRPLCAPLFAEGRLVALSEHALAMPSGYWLTQALDHAPDRWTERLIALLRSAR